MTYRDYFKVLPSGERISIELVENGFLIDGELYILASKAAKISFAQELARGGIKCGIGSFSGQ